MKTGLGLKILVSAVQSRPSPPFISARVITAPIRLASEQAITDEFVKEQLRKCDSKLDSGDFDWAITSSRSLVEGVLGLPAVHGRAPARLWQSLGRL